MSISIVATLQFIRQPPPPFERDVAYLWTAPMLHNKDYFEGSGGGCWEFKDRVYSIEDYCSPILCLGAKQRTPSPSLVAFYDSPGKAGLGCVHILCPRACSGTTLREQNGRRRLHV